MRLVEGYADVEDLDAFLDSLAAIGEAHGCVVQAFDARYVAGEHHLEHALSTARRAIQRGESIARDPAVEVLCYAAGTRQIDDALALGVSEGRTPVVVLVAKLDDDGQITGTDGSTADVDGATADAAETTVDAVEVAAVADVEATIEPADLDRGEEFGDPDRLREYFEIGDDEVAASDADLATLVRERVALLAVDR